MSGALRLSEDIYSSMRPVGMDERSCGGRKSIICKLSEMVSGSQRSSQEFNLNSTLVCTCGFLRALRHVY